MDDSGEPRIPQRHVAELSAFFAAHDRWLFGDACVRTRGDRELAADLVQDTFEAAARAWATLRGHAEGRQRAWLLGTLADRKSTRLNSSHVEISYAVFCLKKKKARLRGAPRNVL